MKEFSGLIIDQKLWPLGYINLSFIEWGHYRAKNQGPCYDFKTGGVNISNYFKLQQNSHFNEAKSQNVECHWISSLHLTYKGTVYVLG